MRLAIAVTRIWNEAIRAEELLLRRPWEAEGELRWVREPGGARLIGQDLPAQRVSLGRRLSGRLGSGLEHRRFGRPRRAARSREFSR